MTSKALFLLDSVRERDLDVLLAAHLTASEAFRAFVLRACGEASPHTLLGCRVSVATDTGETDLLLLVRLDGPVGGEAGQRRLALMLENKINAAFQPEQAARYHRRGEQGILVGGWDFYRTCLVAPKAYIAAVPEEDGWDSRLTLEEIAEWARAAGGPHEAILAQVCGEAVAKQAKEIAGALAGGDRLLAGLSRRGSRAPPGAGDHPAVRAGEPEHPVAAFRRRLAARWRAARAQAAT